MIRTFIAVEVPDSVRDALGRDIVFLKSGAPLVKWVSPDNIHLTLRFLGDVKESDLGELFDALGDAMRDPAPFVLEVRDVGVFPNWRHPRVVWAGAGEGADETTELAGLIEGICVDLGYEPERRPFRPHLTLGRVKQPADASGLAESVAGLGLREYGYIDVDAVTVFMSEPRRTGPVYSPMARFELSG